MVESISGILAGHQFPIVFIQVGPVRLALEVSSTTFREILPDVDATVSLQTHLWVREDALQLFGFATDGERDVFRKLIGVSGIGPRLALKILGGLPAQRLIELLEAEDVDSLVKIPGLGRKTAQKMILQLRGTLVPADGSEASGSSDPHGDIVAALVEMGYDRSRAAATVRDAAADTTNGAPPDESELLRHAIIRLVERGE